MTATFRNRDRVLEPENTASPYYADITSMRRVRCTAQWNLLTANQAAIETDASGWANNGNATVTRTTSQHLSGAAALQLQAIAGGNVSAVTTPGGTSAAVVTRGNWYTAMAWAKAATAARTAQVSILWLDAAGSQISGATGTAATLSTSAWTQAVVTAQAPATAAYARVQVTVLSAVGTEVYYVDQAGLFPMAGVPGQAWMTGGVSTLWGGFIDTIDDELPGRIDSTVTFSCVDLLGSALQAKRLNASGAYAAKVAADGATAHWPFNDSPLSRAAKPVIGSTDIAVIGTSYGYPIFGAPGALVTDIGTAVSMVGYNGWMTGPGPGVTGTGAWSMEVWVLLVPDVNGPGYYIWYQKSPGFFTFVIDSTATQVSANYFATSLLTVSATGLTLGDGNWHHIAWTRAADGKTNKLYVDGVLKQTTVDATAQNIPGGVVLVGAYNNGTDDLAAFNGVMDELAVYQSALTAAQVAAHAAFGPPGWPQQGAAARLTHVAQVLGLQSFDYDFVGGTETLQGVTGSLIQESGLDYAQRVADSVVQEGRLFCLADGRLALRSGAAGASVATFGDGGGRELPYTLGVPKLSYSRQEVFNEIPMQRVGGVLQTASDATSQTDQGAQTLPAKTNLLNTTDTEVASIAAHVLALKKDPKLRIDSLVLEPTSDPRLWPQVLGREIGDVVTVVKRPGWESGGFNLLTANQASLETNTAGWAANGNCAIARNTAQHFSGFASLQMVATAGGNMSAITDGAPVSPGSPYTAMAWCHAGGATRSCVVSVFWYDINGVFLNGVSSSPVTDDAVTWVQVSLVTVAPAGAYFAAIQVTVQSAGATESHYVDQISLARESLAVWTPGGQEIRRDVRIEGIHHDVVAEQDGRKSWRTTWQLSPAS